MKLEREVAAYIAGIIDGEGNIGIGRRPPKPECGEVSPTYAEYVRIAITDYRLLAWIREKVGGVGGIYAEKRTRTNSRQVYSWRITASKCVGMLREIYPYLIIKKEQADVIFRFRTTFDRSRYCRGRVSDIILRERDECCAELVRLHKYVAHGPSVKLGPQTTEARIAGQKTPIDYGALVQ